MTERSRTIQLTRGYVLARNDGTELHIAQDAVIRPVLQLEHMVAEAQAWHNIAHRCRKILNGHDAGQEQIAAEPEPVFADLPPDPALALAPDVLDAEQAARDERRRRVAVLASVGQRRCGLTTPGLFGVNLVCVEPAGHDLPHRTADDTEWRPSVRQLRVGKTEPFVAKVPWRIRIKRGVVGYLEQVKREKAMTLSDTGELDVTSEDEL